MANVSSITGFRPVKHRNGSAFNGQVNAYVFVAADSSAAAYMGDVVKLSGTADSVYGDKPSITLAAAGDAVCGVIVGFLPNYTDLNITGQYRVNSTLRTALVADATDIVFEAETSNGTLTIVDVALNVNHAVGTPSTTTARSGATIDAGTKTTAAATTFKLIGFSARDNNDPTAASSKVLVLINNHQFGAGTGVVGL